MLRVAAFARRVACKNNRMHEDNLTWQGKGAASSTEARARLLHGDERFGPYCTHTYMG